MLALTLSCTKETQGGDHGSQGGGTQTSLELTEFTRLNRGESEINSHADDWDRSTVKMDYRSYIELGAANNVYLPTYARIRTLRDGSYILTWQDAVGVNGNGENRIMH